MRVLVVGAGPAAAGAALALAARSDVEIAVVDVGGQLEPDHDEARRRLGETAPEFWDGADLERVSRSAVAAKGHRVPEKRIFGSDFPFRDFGQLRGVTAEGGVNGHVISGAYGGFSNTWGAQTTLFSAATFRDWPFSRKELEPDYESVLASIPYAAEDDDLSEYFPVLGPSGGLPPLSDRSLRVLEAYRGNRISVRRHGVVLGKARLALGGEKCVRCGLCMTGCPYDLVYSASHTFDALRTTGRVDYREGLVAYEVGEAKGKPYVRARGIRTSRDEVLWADKVFLACGALGTTRLVAHSLEQWGVPIRIQESAQFLLPAASVAPVVRAEQAGTFTLNQFNAVLPFDEVGHDLVQIHFYPYVRAMEQALPGILQRSAFARPRNELLRRLTVGFGYLPSWWSPGFQLEIGRNHGGDLPPMTLSSVTSSASAEGHLRRVARRLLGAAPYLDLYPVLPQVSLSAPAKSYHFGGSFPHSPGGGSERTTDLLGRVSAWRNVHLADASVFPTVPATTFTLTIMANAHRIARQALTG